MINTNPSYYDFIVIGSGLAGLCASLELSNRGEVLLITKQYLDNSTSYLAQGGVAAVTSKNDSFEKHQNDTLKAGSHHNSSESVNYVVKNAEVAIHWLSRQGIRFDKDQKLEAGHSIARIVHIKDETGKYLIQALSKKILENPRIRLLQKTFCIDLIVKDKRAVGVICHLENEKIRKFSAAKIILATGGLGQIYKWTTNPVEATGDGFAMAKRAGAKLADMEFVQFHPTALKAGKSPLFLLSETLRGAGAYIVDQDGSRFVDELSTRDIVSQEIFKKQQKGPIFLDLRHLGKLYISKNFPNIYKTLIKFKIDPSTDLIPITPAAHYICGGVVTNLKGETSIRNLYAVGEVARTGLHGANRLASNSLLEAVVFALNLANSIKSRELQKSVEFDLKEKKVSTIKFDKKTNKQLEEIESRLKNLMWEKAGIIRTEKGLIEAKKEISKMKKELLIYKSHQLIRYLKLINMIEVAYEIVNAAVKRRKSLGCHFIT